jgi:polyphenol oxidase
VQAAILRDDSLTRESWLVHGFSTRLVPEISSRSSGRVLGFNLGLIEGASKAAVERNREKFVHALSTDVGHKSRAAFPPWQLISLKQSHSDIIHVICSTPRDAPRAQLSGDGVVTNVPGMLLAIKTADCFPILLADPEQLAVGAFHAGWRGTLARIIEKGVGVMRKEFGSDPGDIKAAIGPGIHGCCYEVSEELRDQFESQFEYASDLFVENFDVDPVRRKYPMLFLNARAPGHSEVSKQLHLDLVAANRRQLLDAGILDRNTSFSPLCTACRTDLLFSHRREHGKTGRMMAAIGIRK